VRISCGLAPSLDTVQHAKLAEELGYDRVWLYDSPAIYLDIWASLALVAANTERIGLGSAVLVPGLRNVVAEAAAIATIEGAAPGRLALGYGTGATARWTFGKRALSLQTVGDHLRTLRKLLDGEVVEVDGRKVQMDQVGRFAPPRPIQVPFLLSALGPKGQALAKELDGIMTVGFDAQGYEWAARLVVGTVLDPGEPLTSERVKQSAGPWYAIMGHGAWEAMPEAVDGFPGGPEWRAKLEAMRPEGERHLAVHEGHATTVTELDRILVDAAGDGIVGMGWVAEADEMKAKLADAEAGGSTEIIYAPSGPDVARELREFAKVAL
jgi:5,10-methylenetetrahydromethanopterin reductase